MLIVAKPRRKMKAGKIGGGAMSFGNMPVQGPQIEKSVRQKG